MKYAVNYRRDFPYNEDIDELILGYNKDSHRSSLLKFLKSDAESRDSNFRYVIAAEEKVLNKEDVEVFAAAKEIHSNLTVRISLKNRDLVTDFFDKDIPFFFDYFVDSWDVLMSFIQFGVSDVYIVNEFGFWLPAISTICRRENVKVRVFPNVAQSADKLRVLPTINSFFIRPEDTKEYEPYVDVFEFFGSADRNAVLYKIYSQERWDGNLKDLVLGLEEDIHNNCIVPCFGQKRVKCQKVCSQGKCNICHQVLALSQSLKNANLEVKRNE